MLTIRETWEQLVELTSNTDLFDTVKAYPFNRVNDVKFLKDFPGINPPACLIICLGRAKEIKGAADDRTMRWSAVIINRDASGDGWKDAVDMVDKFEDAVLDQQVLDDELTIHGSSDVSPALTSPKYSVYLVQFTTREAGVRA